MPIWPVSSTMQTLLSASLPACFGLARTGTPQPRSAAQAYVDHLNDVLNRTVTDSRLSLIALPEDDAAFEITRLEGRVRAPLDLHGTSLRLFVRQTIVVVNSHCQTESYGYRLQSDASTASWLIRWEYFRDPPRPDYLYPLAHVHVNGQIEGNSLAGLHVPTGRIPLELVIWHLIAEWGVASRSDGWSAILRESISGFDARRTRH